MIAPRAKVFHLRFAGSNVQCIYVSVLAAKDDEFFGSGGRRGYSEFGFEFPTHGSRAGIERVKEVVLGPYQNQVACHSRRGIDAISCWRAPLNSSGCGLQSIDFPVATTEIHVLLGGVGRCIDPATNRLCPTRFSSLVLQGVEAAVGATEENGLIADNGRAPHFTVRRVSQIVFPVSRAKQWTLPPSQPKSRVLPEIEGVE